MAQQPYSRPWPVGFGWIGAVIMVVVALLELFGVSIPKAEWWEVLGFGITLLF